MRLDGQIRTDLTDKQWRDIGISRSENIATLSGRYLINARVDIARPSSAEWHGLNKIIHWVSTDLGYAVPLNFLSSYEYC
ncbi:hypothetical protein [Yersinia phage MHG19]|nr:hypothetical protein [Yersinia phage MHG19]